MPGSPRVCILPTSTTPGPCLPSWSDSRGGCPDNDRQVIPHGVERSVDVKCPSCNADVSSGRRYCTQCGAAVPVVCTACGGLNAAGGRFCGDCGAELHAAEAKSAAV